MTGRRPVRRPSALELRVRELEKNQRRFADELCIDLEEPADTLNLRHGNPVTWQEWQTYCRELADEVTE